MQTFLPYENFQESAKCLDRQRLGKQRVEALMILRCNTGHSVPLNHPAAIMWKGYDGQLLAYINAMREEWIRRGYSDNLGDETDRFARVVCSMTKPSWLGDERLHANHRGRLIAKLPKWYVEEFGGINTEDYNLWPVTTAGPWMYSINGKMVPYDEVYTK
jgi:hypothetical protein